MVYTCSEVNASYMDIQDYLRNKEKRFALKLRQVRDPRVFDFNYIPSKPLLREEMKPVIDALLRYEQTHIANHLLIVGSRGSGKTLSVRFLEQTFRRRGLPVLYSNGRAHNTSYKVLAHLLGVRARGVSFDELTDRFTHRVPGPAVVVLDEADLLSEKDRHKNILYFLSRAEPNYMAVLLSNNPRWHQGLDESIQSTLQPELIHFRAYTPRELEVILSDRAHTGLTRAPATVLKEIAARTAKYAQSDVRVAIKTLYYWATEPTAGLEEQFQRARKDIVHEVLRHLSDKNLLVLRAAGPEEQNVKAVYEAYRSLCARHGEEPFSYVYFYSALSYLQSLGMVLLIATKVGRTYTNRIHLTFPVEMLEQLWRTRFR